MSNIVFDPQLSSYDMAVLEDLVSWIKPDLSVELGSWLGLSTSIIARHSSILYCVDTWKGAISTPDMQKYAMSNDTFSIFRDNMKSMNLWHKIDSMIMSSKDAARIFTPKSIDFLFLDSDHLYDSVVEDIGLWINKIKPGGIFAGHDCELFWSDLTEDQRFRLIANLDKEFLPDFFSIGHGIHPGVVKALHDTGLPITRSGTKSSIWWVQTPNTV